MLYEEKKLKYSQSVHIPYVPALSRYMGGPSPVVFRPRDVLILSNLIRVWQKRDNEFSHILCYLIHILCYLIQHQGRPWRGRIDLAQHATLASGGCWCGCRTTASFTTRPFLDMFYCAKNSKPVGAWHNMSSLFSCPWPSPRHSKQGDGSHGNSPAETLPASLSTWNMQNCFNFLL